MLTKAKDKRTYQRWAYILAKHCWRTDGERLITEEDVVEIFRQQNGKCYWSGIKMAPSEYRRFPSQPSLDRLDHNLPHTPDNVVLCCWALNQARNNTNIITWMQFLDKFKKAARDEKLAIQNNRPEDQRK